MKGFFKTFLKCFLTCKINFPHLNLARQQFCVIICKHLDFNPDHFVDYIFENFFLKGPVSFYSNCIGNIPWNKTACIHIKKCFKRLLSALSGRQGRYAHVYGICASFNCISLKKIYGGEGGITLLGVWFQGILSLYQEPFFTGLLVYL